MKRRSFFGMVFGGFWAALGLISRKSEILPYVLDRHMLWMRNRPLMQDMTMDDVRKVKVWIESEDEPGWRVP